MDDFLKSLKTVMAAATEYGVRNVPIVPIKNKYLFRDYHHQSSFMKACHRGYEKAQSTIFDLLKLLQADTRLSEAEKNYRELVYRRVIDAIAFGMLRGESHVVRRLSFHDRPLKLDFSTLSSAKKTADSMNAESRLTFALLADLSTFIHVCDILRIDLRGRSPGVSLIELKSGQVNTFLLSHLEAYEPRPESVERLRQDNKIDKRYLPQAKRILRQKVRLAQINEVLKYDKGIDIGLNKPMQLSKNVIETVSYDHVINDACDYAQKHEYAATTVQQCIHIGVGQSEHATDAKNKAIRAAQFALVSSYENAPQGLNEVRKELLGHISENELYRGVDLLQINLYGIATEPFPVWQIERRFLIDWIAQKLSIFLIFDLAAFIWLGRSIGLSIGLAKKRETGRFASEMGARRILRWGDYGVQVDKNQGRTILGAGMFGHLLASLKTPLPFLIAWKEN